MRSLTDIALMRTDIGQHVSASSPDGLPRDPGEAAQTIEQAGRNLIRERLLAVSGGGTGPRIATDFSVFLLPPEAGARDAKACWLQWAQDQSRT
jgi:hypothetical protein